MSILRSAFVRTVSVVALAALLGGCEKPEPTVGQVTGMVTIDGKPAANIGIAFIPATTNRADVSPVASAETDASGRYEVSYALPPNGSSEPPVRKPGAALGQNRVILDDAKAKAEHLRISRVPAKYSQLGESGLEVDVKPGSQTYDIPLKSH